MPGTMYLFFPPLPFPPFFFPPRKRGTLVATITVQQRYGLEESDKRLASSLLLPSPPPLNLLNWIVKLLLSDGAWPRPPSPLFSC